MDKPPAVFEQLIGQELSGVTFVRDYIQLQFNPPPLVNVLTPITLDGPDRRVHQGEEAFSNALIAQIGKVVSQLVYEQGNFLRIVFSDTSSLSISLKPEEYVGAEAIIFFGKEKEWDVL